MDPILKQLEFYFSDANLARDKFMQEQLEKSAEEQAIEIDVLLSFKRMQALSVTVDQIQEAVEKSSKLCLNEDKTKIKRVEPFVKPSLDDKELQSRTTILVSNLPKEATLDELIDFFAGLSDKVVMLRRLMDKETFRGLAVLIFNNEDEMREFWNNFGDKTKTVTYQDRKLSFSNGVMRESAAKTKQPVKEKVNIDPESIIRYTIKKINVDGDVIASDESETQEVLTKEMGRREFSQWVSDIAGVAVKFVDMKVGVIRFTDALSQEIVAKLLSEPRIFNEKQCTFEIMSDEEKSTFISTTLEAMAKNNSRPAKRRRRN